MALNLPKSSTAPALDWTVGQQQFQVSREHCTALVATGWASEFIYTFDVIDVQMCSNYSCSNYREYTVSTVSRTFGI